MSKELKSGKLRIDKAKVKQDEKLDGKYLFHQRPAPVGRGYCLGLQAVARGSIEEAVGGEYLHFCI